MSVLPIKPCLKGLTPVSCSSGTVFQDVTHHIAAMKAGDVDGESTIGPHLSVHTAQHREIIGWNLLEVTDSSSVSIPTPANRSKRHSEAPLCCTSSTKGSISSRLIASSSVAGSSSPPPSSGYAVWRVRHSQNPTQGTVYGAGARVRGQSCRYQKRK